MYERLGVPLAFTWEIYGDTKAHFEDCVRMFNPVTQAKFDEVCFITNPGGMVALEGMIALKVPNACAFMCAMATALVSNCFNFLDGSQVVANWTDAVFALMELLPGHPSLPQLKTHAALTGRRANPGGTTGRTLEKSGGRSPLAPIGNSAAGAQPGSEAAGLHPGGGHVGSGLGFVDSGSGVGFAGTPLAMGGLAVLSFVAGAVLSQSRACAVLRMGRRRRLSG